MASIREKLAQKKSKLAQPKGVIEEHPADMSVEEDGTFYNVDVDVIQPNPYQPRQIFDQEKLDELAESIKLAGVIQPIVIRRDETDGTIRLVAGERRLRAARQAGLKQIPAILTKGNPVEIAIIENLQRENLRPIEEAEALQRMMHEFQYTQEELAQVIGKSRTTISETLSLNRLPDRIKQECRRVDSHPRRLLVEVAKQSDEEKMFVLYNKVESEKLKSDQVRQITRSKDMSNYKPTTPAKLVAHKILAIRKYLENISLESSSAEDKNFLVTAFDSLKKALAVIVG